MAPAIYVSNSLTRVTFISNFGNSRPQNLLFSFLVTWSSGSGDGNAQATFRDTHWIFPIHGGYLGQDIPFLGRFWGFIREKCLLFYYIPILGIGCEFFPKLFPKLGTIWEHFPSYSLYRGIIGTCESQYRGIIGTCKSQYRGIIGTCKSQYTGVIETRKIHQRVIIGQIPLRGNFWDMENPLWGEIMWNSCPKIDFGRQFWYFFPNRLYSDCELQKIFCDGRVPCHYFLQESGKIYFFISWKLLYHYGGWSFKSFTYFLLT